MDKKKITKEIIEWIICLFGAIIIALLVRYYIGRPTVVKSVSMNPTLIENQRLWLNRWHIITKKDLKRGDIITFEAPLDPKTNDYKLNLENPVAGYNEIKGVFNKFSYYVLEMNKKSYIKRVIGLPGEYVEIENGNVYIDGKKLEEEYLPSEIVTEMGIGQVNRFKVPEGTYFVLGDNRPESKDSRIFGCIPYEKIESKVVFRFWPLNLFGKVK